MILYRYKFEIFIFFFENIGFISLKITPKIFGKIIKWVTLYKFINNKN